MKKMNILQGIPGSGKSYQAEMFSEANKMVFSEESIICSADKYHGLYVNGVFQPEKLQDAHNWCFRQAINGVFQDIKTITIDNTSLSIWEIQPYWLLGTAFGYRTMIISFRVDPEKAFRRQQHGVPRESFDKMVEKLDKFEPLPFWNYKPAYLEGPA